MPRLTITLTSRAHRALKDVAARQGRSMGEIIEQSLEFRGILPSETVREIVAPGRSTSGLSDEAAMAIAVRETRLHRAENEADQSQRRKA